MFSVINNNFNNQSFTSVVPIRVFVDGQEVHSQPLIRPACLQLNKLLTGPAKNNDFKIKIAKLFALIDPDYNFTTALEGFSKKFNQKRVQPSDYFRYIYNKAEHFLMTGIHAKKIKALGKEVGIEKQACKFQETSNSLDLQVAQQNYWKTIKEFIKNKKLRLTEGYHTSTYEKYGEPVDLIINMKSNGLYGSPKFKMTLDDISFTKSS